MFYVISVTNHSQWRVSAMRHHVVAFDVTVKSVPLYVLRCSWRVSADNFRWSAFDVLLTEQRCVCLLQVTYERLVRLTLVIRASCVKHYLDLRVHPFCAILTAGVSGLLIALEFPQKCRAGHLRHGHLRHMFLVTEMTMMWRRWQLVWRRWHAKAAGAYMYTYPG